MEKGKFTILVADDDEILLQVIGSILSEEGYAVLSAKNGTEALEKISAGSIDLVITDLRMPGADGIEVLRYCIEKDAQTPVVILTAYGALDTTLEAMQAGACDYVTKPFKRQQILIIADRAFKRAQCAKENREIRDCLGDLFRDLELFAAEHAGGASFLGTPWLERLDRLEALAVLTSGEAARMKETLVEMHAVRKDSVR